MNSGELLASYDEEIRVQTAEEVDSSKKYFENKRTETESFGRMNTLYEKRGGFIWNIYSGAKLLFPEIKASSLTRLMFLATYLGYDGYLVESKKLPIFRKDLETLLGIKQKECRRFWNNMESAGLMREEDNKIYLNENMFSRGSFSKDKIKSLSENEQYITRIYIKGVRSLYRTATKASHATLSYIFRILPYVNKEYNVCCFNPLEQDKHKIQPMSLGDFADIIGYNRTNISKLYKILFEPRFEVDGKSMSATRYVSTSGFGKETLSMFINPCVYYAGTHWNEVEILGCF